MKNSTIKRVKEALFTRNNIKPETISCNKKQINIIIFITVEIKLYRKRNFLK